MNKKVLPILLVFFACLLLLSSCGGDDSSSTAPAADAPATAVETTAEIPVILNQTEYVLYQNIFGNDYRAQYDGVATTKDGVFAVIQDAYSDVIRYYVWGYLDQTMCCDWQWEFVPAEPDKLPVPGSRIKVTGTYQKSDDALDKFWIVDAKVETLALYTGEQVDLNMRTMSDTLERVQLASMFTHPEQFNDKEYIVYARVVSNSILQDPYYDGSWQIPYETEETMPAIGTIVVLKGVYRDKVMCEAILLSAME